MKILHASNTQKVLIKKDFNRSSQISFKRKLPSKVSSPKTGLINKASVLWIDIKRNYSFFDSNFSGEIQTNMVQKSPILKKVFSVLYDFKHSQDEKYKVIANPLVKKAFNLVELPLKNYHKVSKNYVRGGILTCEYDILRLKEKGVTDLISLTEVEMFNPELARFAQKQGLNYHHIELRPPVVIPTESQIKRFFEIIKNNKGGVYVHCLHGKERTGIMTFMYEIDVLKRKPEQVLNHLVKAGFNVKRNHNLLDFLAERYPSAANLIENVKLKY